MLAIGGISPDRICKPALEEMIGCAPEFPGGAAVLGRPDLATANRNEGAGRIVDRGIGRAAAIGDFLAPARVCRCQIGQAPFDTCIITIIDGVFAE